MGMTYIPGIGYIDTDAYAAALTAKIADQGTGASGETVSTETYTQAQAEVPYIDPAIVEAVGTSQPPQNTSQPDTEEETVDPLDKQKEGDALVELLEKRMNEPGTSPEDILSEMGQWTFQQLHDYSWAKATRNIDALFSKMNWEEKAFLGQLSWLIREVKPSAEIKIKLPSFITNRFKAMFPVLGGFSIPPFPGSEKFENDLVALARGMYYSGLTGTTAPIWVMYDPKTLEDIFKRKKYTTPDYVDTFMGPKPVPSQRTRIEADLGLADVRALQSRILGSIGGILAIPFLRPIAEILGDVIGLVSKRQLMGNVDAIREMMEGADDTEDRNGGGGGGSTSGEQDLADKAEGLVEDVSEIDSIKQELIDMQSEYDALSEESQAVLDAAFEQIDALQQQLLDNTMTAAQYAAQIAALNRTISALTAELRGFVEDFDLSNIPIATSLPTLDLNPGGGSSRVNCELIVDTAMETGDYTNIPPECHHLLNETILKKRVNYDRTNRGVASSPGFAKRSSKRWDRQAG
jgi:hypothetical protein